MVRASLLVEHADPARLDQGIDKQFLRHELRLRPGNFALDQVAALRLGDQRGAPARVREQIVFLGDTAAFPIITLWQYLYLPKHTFLLLGSADHEIHN